VRRIDEPLRWSSSYSAAQTPAGVAAMIENIVRGFVIVAVIVMVVLAYAQKHEGCLRGRSLETLQPCGSVGHNI
jgi:hypothetical protein